MDCTIFVAKTKVMNSCTVLAQICLCFLQMQKAGFLMKRLIVAFIAIKHNLFLQIAQNAYENEIFPPKSRPLLGLPLGSLIIAFVVFPYTRAEQKVCVISS